MYSPVNIEKYYVMHSQAFGISFTEENYENVKNLIDEFAEEEYAKGNLKNTVYIDREINLDDIDEKMIYDISTLEPYGMDNPTPLFMTRGIIITDIECRNFNTFLTFENIGSVFSFEGIKSHKGIMFKRDLNGEFNVGDVVDIIYELTYSNTLLIKDIKISNVEEV